jgi:RNA polymerase sigma-70 factor, ECF subfamily
MGSTTRRHRRRVTTEQAVLVARLHAGDRDAFDRLYRQHVAAVSRYVAARLGGRHRDGVDDCVHDAFCDALADPTLIGADVLGSLLRLAARAVTRHGWSQRRYVRAAYTVYADTTGGTTGGHPTTAPATTSVGRLRIRHALARLSDEQRQTVQLRYLDGHPRAAVAALMDRTVDAVRTLERQAVAHLRVDLGAIDISADDLGGLAAATSATAACPA